MQVRYQFGIGVTFAFPPYEGELSIKVLRLLIKEMEKNDLDSAEFQSILVMISEEKCRKQ